MSSLRRAGLAAMALCAMAVPARAQDIRGSLLTTARYITLRPLIQLQIARDSVQDLGQGRYEFDGNPVYCQASDTCIQYQAADAAAAVALTQDLGFTAWGFGVRGLSATVQLRGRSNASGDLTWPRSADAFDALLAYVELNRPTYRVRLGRLRNLSGLGFTGYDGASVRLDPLGWMRLEAYGGRSLARGLAEPREPAAEGVEPFLEDRSAYLYGAFVEAEPVTGTVASVRYQREIWSGGNALVSERASLDLRTTALRPVQLEASADYDFAFARFGKAHVTARLPVRPAHMALEVTTRRYTPYFELWTIWGMFSPVAYNEALVRLSWVPTADAQLWVSGGYREYEATDAPVILEPLDGTGRRVALGGSWQFPNLVTLRGSYDRDWGPGASLSSGDLAATWHARRNVGVTLRGTAFQQLGEYRVGDGMVVGGGLGTDVGVTSGIRLSGGVDLYHQTFESRPGSPDWDQVRGWATVRIGFGEDPGRAGGGR